VDRPAFDFIAQAMAGFMATTGAPSGEPMRAAPPITDLIAGLYCAYGVVNALRARDLTGKGQKVESAMVNGMVSLLAYLASEYFSTGEEPARTGNDHPIASPYGLFHARDGAIAIAPATTDILAKFMRELGLAYHLERPDLKTPEQRRAARAELNGLVNAALGVETQDYWIDRLNKAGVPAGKVLSIAEVFSDPQIAAQEMAIDVEHPGHGTVRMTGFPVKLSDTPARVRLPAPDLGAHTTEVLGEIGLSPADVQRLRAGKVVA
jgi:crotonobetainyl-CoA:carnitine CoA-transferase CaiB-like acyl-CoA transferase